MPSRLSDRYGFVKETLASMGATDGNAPTPDLAATVAKPAGVDHPKRPFVSPTG
jgi:hypothetical protein